MSNEKVEKKDGWLCADRRQFLLSGGAVMALTMLGKSAEPVMAKMMVKGYPRKKIGRLSKLRTGKAVTFTYPDDDAENMLVKVGERCGAGVGPKQDVVAFNTLCTHMGGDLTGQYRHADKAIGACQLHLSSFDVTRYGMIIAGHATESLPQIQLEVEGDDIYAVGVMGLLYGRNNNLG